MASGITVERADIFSELTRGMTLQDSDRPPGKPTLIKAGVHSLPFTFTVQSRAPSSFKTEFSAVQFELHASVTRGAWSKDLNIASAVNVVNSLIPALAGVDKGPATAAVVNRYQQQGSGLGFETAQLVRSTGIWSKIQPFEVLYRHQTVYWGQKMPVTVRSRIAPFFFLCLDFFLTPNVFFFVSYLDQSVPAHKPGLRRGPHEWRLTHCADR